MSSDLNNDASITPETARALHRVVRAMHDGNCPRCGILENANHFRDLSDHDHPGYRCPECDFAISDAEAHQAMMAFRPYMVANLAAFEEWRRSR